MRCDVPGVAVRRQICEIQPNQMELVYVGAGAGEYGDQLGELPGELG